MNHIRTTTHTARRSHARPCFDCQTDIQPGDGYHRSVWSADGAIYSIIEHDECRAAVVEILDPHELGDGYDAGLLLHDDGLAPKSWAAWMAGRA